MNRKLSFLFILGFVSLANAEPKLPAKAQITGDFVGVRKEPNKKAPYVGMLYKNIIVDVSICSEKTVVENKTYYWCKISTGNIGGWCFSQFLDFELKNKEVNTYEAPSDLGWFFKRYGRSTYEYLTKIDITSFTLDEYRSLISSIDYPLHNKTSWEARSLAREAASILEQSLYRDFNKKSTVAPFPYIAGKIFTPEFLYAMFFFNGDSSVILGALPSDLRKDRAYVMNLIKSSISEDSKPVNLRVGILEHVSVELKDDEEIVKIAIEKNARDYCAASERLRSNRELMLMALTKDGSIFRCVPEKFRDDRGIAIIALRGSYTGENFTLLSDRLRGDKELAMSTIKYINRSFRYMSDKLRDDDEIVEKAFSGENYHIESIYPYLSPRLKKNRALALRAVQKQPTVLKHLNEDFKDDKEILEMALTTNPWSYQFASEKMRDSEEIAQWVLEITNKSPCYPDEEYGDPAPLPEEECKKKNRDTYLQWASPRIKEKFGVEPIKNKNLEDSPE